MNDKPIIPDVDTQTSEPLTNGVAKEGMIVPSNLPLPVALRNDEISEEDFEALCRIAETPDATTGRLQRVPRKTPAGDRPQTEK